jgi:hypothetical protein
MKETTSERVAPVNGPNADDPALNCSRDGGEDEHKSPNPNEYCVGHGIVIAVQP